MVSERIVVSIMVWNEEDTIIKTLNSCHQLIKKLCIVDTCSTDNTVSVIEDYCRYYKIPLHLWTIKWENFSQGRNYLLEQTEKLIDDGEFYMILDANDELKYEWHFPDKLSHIPLGTNTIMVQSHWYNGSGEHELHAHPKVLLIRSGCNVRYLLYLHEIITINGIEMCSNDIFWLEKVSLYQDRTLDNIKTSERQQQDIQLLNQQLIDFKDTVHTSRTLFYIGRLYMRMKEYSLAREYFELFLNGTFKHVDDNDAYMARMYYADALLETGSTWPEQLIHILDAHQLMPHKIEALMHVIAKYCQLEQWNVAYIFASYICNLQPRHTDTGVTLFDYQVRRWYFLALICHHLKKYDIGFQALHKIGDDVLDELKCSDKWKFSIGVLRGMYYPLHQFLNIPVILLFGGFGYRKWSGKSINEERGLGGAETVVTHMATNLRRKQALPVLVCCDTETVECIDDVIFFPIDQYELFTLVHKIDTLIVFRYTQFLRYSHNIQRVVLILEDVSPVTEGMTGVIPDDDKLKYIICKTKWHRNTVIERLQKAYQNFEENVDLLIDKLRVIGNAIDPNRFYNLGIIKKQWRFVWSSCPTRGAWNVARMIPKILKIVPEATFHFFIDEECPYYQSYHRIPELFKKLRNMPNVRVHSRVSQQKLAEEMLQSDIWLYPTDFKETYCITALEAQMAKVLCIYSNNSCLDEVIGNRGILISGDPNDERTDNKYLSTIFDLKFGKIDRDKYVQKGCEWASQQTWNNRVDEFMKLFEWKSKEISLQYQPNDKPKVLIVCCQNYWHQWDGESANSDHGIGGAELVAITMGEYLASTDKWDVYFTCNCEKKKIWNKVTYLPVAEYMPFVQRNRIHTLINYRFASTITYDNVDNVILSVEDKTFWGSIAIDKSKFRYILCKSDWHRDDLLSISEQLKPYLRVLGNGIDVSRFDSQVCKVKNRFIYSTDPNRALNNILRIFPKIRKFLPDATLHVFCDMKYTNYGKRTEQTKELYERLQHAAGVVIYPWVSQQRLAKEILMSEYWLFPTDIPETYSITALEMQLGRVHCVYRKFSGLLTTIGNRGYGIEGDPRDGSLDDQYVEAVRKIDRGEFNKLDEAEQWAREQTWDRVGEQLHQIISEF